ncbi:hypothetical protein PF010_g20311 [Phytophthora fragariae]|uniref:Secreted protein n=1 Tax=Phytophthora fragariae TaxID=53985 RepID=A0A6A3IUZ1_9STRA|nr:hypothetical protein PF011_g20218 [Phytophthora fragariae]KAE9085849.1 hypothetical protein PF010_g20311 [Phytophthora fragariae]KAE9213170.1 hypothetical protein PF004_g15423 [Phytophthora fragariae]
MMFCRLVIFVSSKSCDGFHFASACACTPTTLSYYKQDTGFLNLLCARCRNNSAQVSARHNKHFLSDFEGCLVIIHNRTGGPKVTIITTRSMKT